MYIILLIKYMHVQANNNRCGFDNVVFVLKHFYWLISIQNKFPSLNSFILCNNVLTQLYLLDTSKHFTMGASSNRVEGLSFCDVEHLHDLSTAIRYRTQQL